jgi:predicted nucleic-acid-binding Zn-ribbon protein
MQADSIQAGEWYHSVECSHCGGVVYAFHARSGQQERLPGPGLFAVRCPQCRCTDFYRPNAFTARPYRGTREREMAMG